MSKSRFRRIRTGVARAKHSVITVCPTQTAPTVEKLTRYAKYDGHSSMTAPHKSCSDPAGTASSARAV
jgi:hypothetical protein